MPPDPKPERGHDDADADARLEFRIRVLACDQGCVVHDDPDDCTGDVEAHHVITQQQLRKRGLHAYLWDPRNGAAVCDGDHDRHHLAFARIPRDRLPARCVAFAHELGLDAVLARYYATNV